MLNLLGQINCLKARSIEEIELLYGNNGAVTVLGEKQKGTLLGLKIPLSSSTSN